MIALQNFFFAVGCAVFPVYIFPPGTIQVSHALLFIAAILVLMQERIFISNAVVILLALAFVSLSRETYAVINGGSAKALVEPLYILYNLLLLVAVRTAYITSRSTRCFQLGFAGAVTLALVVTIAKDGIDLTGTVGYRGGKRFSGTFSHANQFAYFAAITFSLIVLLYTFKHISARIMAISIAILVALTLASLSKAGILGMAIGLFFLSIGTVSMRLLMAIGAGSIFLLHQFGYFDVNELLVVQRILHIGKDHDDGFAQRGYFVLFEFARTPIELWFGLGAEGVRQVHDGREIHSTYLSYFGNYGLVGGVLYLMFLFSWVQCLYRSLPLAQAAAIMFPVLFYGIPHNGTRFSILYILIALTFCLAEEGRVRLRERPRGPAVAKPRGALPSSIRGRPRRTRI